MAACTRSDDIFTGNLTNPMHDANEINPYAPSQVHVESMRHPASWSQTGSVYRVGNHVYVQRNADLPPFCMVSGEPAEDTWPVDIRWHPRRYYLLLLLGVLPYFFVAPTTTIHIRLALPLAPPNLRRHNNLVRNGIAILIAGILLLPITGISAAASAGLTIVGVTLALVLITFGLLLSSRQPANITVVSCDRDNLIIKDVHPDYLNRLPSQ